MKKLYLFASICFLLTGCNVDKNNSLINYSSDGYQMKEIQDNKITVAFYYNFNKQETNLNSGLYASGDSFAFKVDQIDKGSKAEKPEINPIRVGYEFLGWHTKETETSIFDFETTVLHTNTFLYAHWGRTQEEEFVEPEYVEPSRIDDTIQSLVSITGVLNVSINSNMVSLPQASLNKLTANSSDVVSLLNYKIKTGVSLSASFDISLSKISYSATKGNENFNGTVSVSNNVASLVVNNSTYENKAKNYENNASSILDYKIMLAGSSSMENWSTSTKDLLPLTTYNHGIGGTTAQQWRDCLNQRLVYPFSPKTVVYYVGVNNLINSGDSTDVTIQALTQMFNDVHSHLPNTKVYWVLINALPGYPTYLDKINTVNNAVKQYEQNHDFLSTINAGEGLLKENGKPNSAFFLTDGLHMSKYGYVIWGGVIKTKLIEDMKKNA